MGSGVNLLPHFMNGNKSMMVDIETLSVKPNAHILSIGCSTMGDNPSTFYRVLGIDGQGRDVNDDTIEWWVGPRVTQAARDEVLIETKASLKAALVDLHVFYKECKANEIWSHGSVFDVIILEDAYKHFKLEPPWNFLNIRDTRTLINLSKKLRNGKDFEPDRVGTYHSAMEDAKFQAKWMNNIMRELR